VVQVALENGRLQPKAAVVAGYGWLGVRTGDNGPENPASKQCLHVKHRGLENK
jgi:hypothetical protein